eukprot:SAG11_NODE_386_length_9887_cov_3.904986_4_plen_74_part_00
MSGAGLSETRSLENHLAVKFWFIQPQQRDEEAVAISLHRLTFESIAPHSAQAHSNNSTAGELRGVGKKPPIAK